MNRVQLWYMAATLFVIAAVVTLATGGVFGVAFIALAIACGLMGRQETRNVRH